VLTLSFFVPLPRGPKPTPQTLPQAVAQSELFAKVTVPAFLTGLALGVAVTAAVFRFRGSSQ
jgi:hypothetical protein